MRKTTKIFLTKFSGLVMGVIAILLKEEITQVWDIVLWIPISFGFALWFTDAINYAFEVEDE